MTAKELKLDYFQIYDVANREATGNVFLQGQFDARQLKMKLALLDFFANPVAKNPGKPVRQVRNPHGNRVRVARPDPESRIGECVP